MSAQPFTDFSVYWEEQESGFCGVHCVNNLLQGAYFTEINFSDIALELDAAEKKLMSEMGTDTAAFLTYMAADSNNVDKGGNFSVEVLRKALEVMGLSMKALTTETAQVLDNPNKEDAFVLNLKNHWFCLRKLHGTWFNLNSIQTDPVTITPFYLSAFLQQMKLEGYVTFVVKGPFPRLQEGVALGGRGTYLPASPIIARNGKHGPGKSDSKEAGSSSSSSSGSSSGSQDAGGVFERTQGYSLLQDRGGGGKGGGNEQGWEDFSHLTDSPGQQQWEDYSHLITEPPGGAGQGADPDYELKAVLELSRQEELARQVNESKPEPGHSLAPEPVEGAHDVTTLQLNLPGGKKMVRRFLESQTIQQVFEVLRHTDHTLRECSNLVLRRSLPPKLYSDSSLTLKDAGLTGRQSLFVEKRIS